MYEWELDVNSGVSLWQGAGSFHEEFLWYAVFPQPYLTPSLSLSFSQFEYSALLSSVIGFDCGKQI